jgi:hypothetical protein
MGDQNIVKNDGKIDKQSILALYKNSNSSNNISGLVTANVNNNHIFNNANILPQNNQTLILQQQQQLQQQQFNIFNMNNNNINPNMPQSGFPKPAQPQNFTNNNSFPANFNTTPQSNPMNLVKIDFFCL